MPFDFLANLNPPKKDVLDLGVGKKKNKTHPLIEVDPSTVSHSFMYNNFIPIDASPINFYSIKKQASWLSHNCLYTGGAFLSDYLNFKATT
jgi:hypothetical protein